PPPWSAMCVILPLLPVWFMSRVWTWTSQLFGSQMVGVAGMPYSLSVSDHGAGAEAALARGAPGRSANETRATVKSDGKARKNRREEIGDRANLMYPPEWWQADCLQLGERDVP